MASAATYSSVLPVFIVSEFHYIMLPGNVSGKTIIIRSVQGQQSITFRLLILRMGSVRGRPIYHRVITTARLSHNEC